MPINGPTTDNKNALVDLDFETDAFAHGPLLQPVVKVDSAAALTGTGSTANPLEVVISTDLGNSTTFGGDGGVFTPTGANFDFNVLPTMGVVANITQGETLSLTGGDGIDTVGSIGDIIDVSVDISSDPDNELSFGSDTGLYSPVDNFFSSFVGSTALGPVDISGAGTVIVMTGPTLVITNFSTTAVSYGFLTGAAKVQVTLQALGVWRMDVLASVNAGPFVLIDSSIYGTFPGTTGLPWIEPINSTFSILGGGVYTVAYRIEILTLVPSVAGSSWNSATIDYQAAQGTF